VCIKIIIFVMVAFLLQVPFLSLLSLRSMDKLKNQQQVR
jgi:hypothetical protein